MRNNKTRNQRRRDIIKDIVMATIMIALCIALTVWALGVWSGHPGEQPVSRQEHMESIN